MKLTSAARMYDADATAIHVEGIPSTVLMWNAAGHIARAAMEVMGARRCCVVFCGSGNNGGDGIGAAALLRQRGVDLRCVLVGSREKLTPDALEMERRLKSAGGVLEDFASAESTLPDFLARTGVLIDALCGIGLHRPIDRGMLLSAVRLMNESAVPIVAADIPSGVEADTAAVRGEAVRCVRTVTFSMAKPGHFIEPGCIYCGEVEVCDIGIPASCLEDAFCGVETVSAADVQLPARPRLSHKGDFGRILILGGSVGYTGAPNLTAAAALRAGAGLVSLGVPESIWQVCAVKNTEAMPFPLPADEKGRFAAAALSALQEKPSLCDVLVMGPGMGRGEGVKSLVCALLTSREGPTVLDADALWAVSDDPGILKRAKGPVVLTPHTVEFRRLGGELTGDRLCDAQDFAKKYGCTVLLKGHRSIVAFPDGSACVITAGNPGMARGGSGDVLAGVLAAMLGQLPWREAVVTGAWLHAAAGDECAARLGEYGMLPTDMIALLPGVMKSITTK